MSWVKEANKIGKYLKSYRTFRVYCIEEGRMSEKIEKRNDGLYRITEFIKGRFVAIHKNGCTLESSDVESLAVKIDIHLLLKHFDSRLF